MAPGKNEATIILLDVGENTLEASGKPGSTFFDRAKQCVSKIIQKKIFAKPNDEIALILMGCDDTNNDLNTSLGGFDHVIEKIELQASTWDMVRLLEVLAPGDYSSDWVDGLVVALNYAKNEAQAKKFSNIRILLITNFMTEVSDDNMDVVIENIKNSNVELLGISDCIEHDDQMKSSQFTQNPTKSTNQMKSQKLFSEVVEKVGGFLCHIDHAETQLLTFQKKATKSMPWNAKLTIGSRLNINISGYVCVQEEKFLNPFKTQCALPNTITKMVTEYTQNNQPIEKPTADDIVKAYMYGSKLVALPNDIVEIPTETCLSCLGFTKREFVLKEYLIGKGCHLVLPRRDHPKSAKLFASLVTEMQRGGFLMVARKVYRKGLKPIIVVLLPNIVNNAPCLTMIQLAFADDISQFSFPRLESKKTAPSKEQEKVIQELVDAMDLMNAIDDDSGLTEAFSTHTTLNPVNQHLCRTVAYRALNPTNPLPKIDPELVAMIDVPEKLKTNAESIVKKIEELFPLQKVERKVKKVFGQTSIDADGDDEMNGDTISDMDSEKNIIAVGTVTPAEDFGYLVSKGERFSTVAEQIQTVIYDLIFRTASLQLEKVLECLVVFREKSKTHGPFTYNNWIKELKNAIIQRNRLEFWQDSIVREGLGLITVNEAAISTVTIADQLEFYEFTAKDPQQTVAMEAEDDDDDLDALLG